MTTEARKRLTQKAVNAGNTWLDAILADYDALAALVDWPELLAAGERQNRMMQLERTTGNFGEWTFDRHKVNEWAVVADQPNGADAPTERKES